MNDKRKTKKQLLEDLQLERERSLALQEVSKRVAAAHDTDEVLDLIVNEAARLLGVDACFIRLLEGDHLTASVATEAAVEYLAELQPNTTVGEGMSFTGHVLATKRPRTAEEVQDDDLISPEAKKDQKNTISMEPLQSRFWPMTWRLACSLCSTRAYASSPRKKYPS